MVGIDLILIFITAYISCGCLLAMMRLRTDERYFDDITDVILTVVFWPLVIIGSILMYLYFVGGYVIMWFRDLKKKN